MKGASFGEAMEDFQIVYRITSPLLVPAQIKDGSKKWVEAAL